VRTPTPNDPSIADLIPAQTTQGRAATHLLAAPRRISVPKAAASALGVVACSLGFATTSNLFASKTPVLVVARPIRPGQLITVEDLRAVRAATDPGIDSIPASQVVSIVDRPAAVPLAPGTLLGRADVGTATSPVPGQAVTAVALKAGTYPLNLAAGDRVQVVPAGTPQAGPSPEPSESALPMVAVVTAVSQPDTQGAIVADLLLDEAGAAKVAAAPAGTALTLLSAGAS
jgi:hypothetical protein